jgi:hypothetical protein
MRLEPIALFVVFAWGVLAVAELAGIHSSTQAKNMQTMECLIFQK